MSHAKQAQDTGRATLGVIARLIMVIAATFLFAAFSTRSPTHPQTQPHGQDQAVALKPSATADQPQTQK